MQIQPIGLITTPFKTLTSMPIQPKGAQETVATITLDPIYEKGLEDLEGFSHLYLIYFFHKASKVALSVTPFMDTKQHGVYATRSPLRPNHIGLSVVELVSINKNIITIKGVDIVDGTPLLDIKPYIAAFDSVSESRSGWMDASSEAVKAQRSDGRFV